MRFKDDRGLGGQVGRSDVDWKPIRRSMKCETIATKISGAKTDEYSFSLRADQWRGDKQVSSQSAD